LLVYHYLFFFSFFLENDENITIVLDENMYIFLSNLESVLFFCKKKKQCRTKLQRIKKNVERIFNLKDRSIWFVLQLNMIVICYMWCNCKEQMNFFYLHSMWSYFSTIIFPSTIIKQSLKSTKKKQILLDTQTWKLGEKK
jgi:hypothetical protein